MGSDAPVGPLVARACRGRRYLRRRYGATTADLRRVGGVSPRDTTPAAVQARVEALTAAYKRTGSLGAAAAAAGVSERTARRHLRGRRSRERDQRATRARELRAQGWAVSCIAADLGVSTRTVRRYLEGSRPSRAAVLARLRREVDALDPEVQARLGPLLDALEVADGR